MFGINGWEFVVLALLAVFLLGPDRLPVYAAKLANGVRRLRVSAENASAGLREQLGPEFDDIDWKQYDPRQYDPRRIVREVMQEPLEYAAEQVRAPFTASAATAAVTASVDEDDTARLRELFVVNESVEGTTPADEVIVEAAAYESGAYESIVDPLAISLTSYDPARPTPWDVDAT